MKQMNRLLKIFFSLVATATMVVGCGNSDSNYLSMATTQEQDGHHEEETGPNGGRLLEDGNFAIEVTIVEAGIPPEFHLYAYKDGVLLSPDSVVARVTLHRLGGGTETVGFEPEHGYLRGTAVIVEPHSFDVSVTATHSGKSYEWEYESHEGRTEIPERIALASGIKTESATAKTIVETVELTGSVQANPANVSRVRARFAGVVTRILVEVGDKVSRGDVLGYVETNESLQSIPIVAPISGLVVNRDIQIGQVTSIDPLFIIADFSEVWVQLDVFGMDISRIQAGQQATISLLDDTIVVGTIDYVSPLVAHGSQSIRARVPLSNPDNTLRAGQFARAAVVVAKTEVPLAVQRKALQTFRDFDVVFAKVENVYEVRMLELGLKDSSYVEVRHGLQPGDVYVTDNSYLIKADIEKSGASHDH